MNVDGVVRTLVTRGLVEEAGIDAESGAILYRTSSYFLERMGLAEISDLPDIAPMLPEIGDMADADWTESVVAPHEADLEADEPNLETDDPSTDPTTGA